MPADPNRTADHAPAADTPRPDSSAAASTDPNRTTGLNAPAPDAPTEATVPGYEILGELGRGGMGVVYRARDTRLNRVVAIKMVLGRPGTAELMRFRAEAEAMAAVRDPNVAQVYEAGEADGRPFLALELLSGGTFADHLAREPDPAARADLVRRVTSGVAAAHAAGIVHRDLKPGNVLFDENGEPKVTDFGLAKRDAGSDLTATGAVMGTPAYMAPEQASGNTKFVGPQADVWALGVMLYEALAGTRPFAAADVRGLLAQVLTADPVPPRRVNPSVPRDLELVCLKCLAKESHERYPTAAELAGDLGRFARHEPISVRPAGPVERAAKWVRRNKVVSGAAAAVFLALAVGAGVSIAFGLDARDQAIEAKKQKKEADDAAEREKGEAARANREKQDAVNARDAEGRAKRSAQEQTARAEGLLTANRLQQVRDAIQGGNIRLATDLLNDCQWNHRGWEYDHLWTRVTPLRSFWTKDMASSLWVSADGSVVAANEIRGPVRAWNVVTGVEKALPAPVDRELTELTQTAGGEVVGVRTDLRVLRWDATTGRQTSSSVGRPTPPGKTNFTKHVALSPDGRWIVHSLSVDAGPNGEYVQHVELWDVENDKFAKQLTRHTNRITALRFGPNGNLIATASTDKTVKLWDLAADAETVLPLGKDWCSDLWFTPDGSGLLVQTSENGQTALKLWHLADRKLTQTYVLEGCQLHDLDISADGKFFATGEHDGRVRIWSFATGKPLWTYYGHTSVVHKVRFSGNGKRLTTADYRGVVSVWDATQDPAVPTLSAGKSAVRSAAFSPDGKTFLTGDQQGRVHLWDAEARTRIRSASTQIPGDQFLGEVWDIAYTPDGTRFATCGQEVKLWDARTGALVRAFTGHVAVVFNLAFSPDGKRLYASPNGHHPRTGAASPADVWVWEVDTGRKLAQFTAAEKRIESEGGRVGTITFAPDGRLVTSSLHPNSGGVIKFWETTNHTVVGALTGHPGRVQAIAFDRDGTRMASACTAGELILWDLRTGEQLHRTRVRDGQLGSLRFSPDGARLLSGCSDGSVRVWDPRLFQEMLALPGHARGDVRALALSPDGKRLVSGGADGSVRIWEALRSPQYADLKGHRTPVTRIAFAPDGGRVFAWDKNGELLAWFLRDGSPAETAGAPADGTAGAVTSPDGRFRAEPTGSPANGNVALRVWFLSPK